MPSYRSFSDPTYFTTNHMALAETLADVERDLENEYKEGQRPPKKFHRRIPRTWTNRVEPRTKEVMKAIMDKVSAVLLCIKELASVLLSDRPFVCPRPSIDIVQPASGFRRRVIEQRA